MSRPKDVLYSLDIRVNYRCFDCDHVVTDTAITEAMFELKDCPKCHGDLEPHEVIIDRTHFRRELKSFLQRMLEDRSMKQP